VIKRAGFTISANLAVTKGAREAIEAAGGSVEA
jgi:ribosomal protein L15